MVCFLQKQESEGLLYKQLRLASRFNLQMKSFLALRLKEVLDEAKQDFPHVEDTSDDMMMVHKWFREWFGNP